MPNIIDHDQYRKEILTQCFDLFAEKGYGSVTIRQIARDLKISTGTLYHYFPSKAALFEQLVEELSQQDILMATAKLKQAASLTAKMRALGEFLARNEERLNKQICIWVDFCKYQDREVLRHSQVFQRINERYEQAIADLLGITDPTIAGFILTSIDGILLERLWGNQQVSFTQQIDLLGRMLSAYLELQPKGDQSTINPLLKSSTDED